MRALLVVVGALLACACAAAPGPPLSGPLVIQVAVLRSVDSTFTPEAAIRAEDYLISKLGVDVQVVLTDQVVSSFDYFDLLRTQLLPRDVFDVYMVDSIWASALSDYFVDPRAFPATNASLCATGEEGCDYLPAFLHLLYTMDGGLVAVPLFGTMGLLYSRADLLDKHPEIPRPPYATYADLAAAAAAVYEAEGGVDPDLGAAYGFALGEQATVIANTIEWTDTNMGGRIVNERGGVTVNNPGAAEAFWEAMQWVRDGLVPAQFLNISSTQLAAQFRACHIAFMRNWASEMPAVSADAMRCTGETPRVSVSTLPGRSYARAWGLAIAKSSKVKAAASELIAYLNSPEYEAQRSLTLYTLPARQSGFELLCAQNATVPFCDVLGAPFSTTTLSLPVDTSRASSLIAYFSRWMDEQLRSSVDEETFHVNLRQLHRDLSSLASFSAEGSRCGEVYGVVIQCASGLQCISGKCENRSNMVIGLSVSFSVLGFVLITALILYPFRKQAALLRWNAYAVTWDDLHLDDAPIGRGAYGVVYKGTYRNTVVAVKRFLHQENYSEMVKEFKREARLLASLRHPNLVLFMGACYEKMHLAIVTEFMPNGTLHSVLHDADIDLDWSLRMRMLRDICCGMAFLHSNRPPILHRDLKSPNILVDADFRLKVADFGLTVLKGQTSDAKKKKDLESTDSISVQGSLFWTAPEVMRNMPYTEQCDVYSFGIVCWEVLSREALYPEMHPLSVGYLVMVENYRPPIPDGLPEHLAGILKTCWSPEPAERPAFQSLLNTFDGLASPYLSKFINSLREFQDMQRKEVEVQRDFSARLDDIAPEVPPPGNACAVVVADVDRWGTLWDRHPAAMVDAVRSYHMILRRNMRECRGFEANLEGRALLAAFEDVGDAVRWAMRVQIACVEHAWPDEILESAECSSASVDGLLIFSGFRVRMGVHFGEPGITFNPLTRRLTYHGVVVNYATQLSAEAMGGQILLSPDAASALQSSSRFPIDMEPEVTYAGEALILQQAIQAMQILPRRLLARKFDTTARHKDHINAELDLFGSFMHSHKWHIPLSEIQKTGQEIARGTAFQVYEGAWRGMRVAVKKMDLRRVRGVNADMEGLSLGGPAMGMGMRRGSNRPRLLGGGYTALLQISTELSLIFSLHHPNLLLYMGAGADESGLHLVSELMERLSLHHILITRKERPDWPVRARMMRDVANAFNYLHSFKPPILHGRFKLQSVLVSHAWQVKVSGYGMSRIFMQSQDAGTVDHSTAPEVLEGKPPTTHSDAYAFGIVMWETLCGTPAYADMSKGIDWVAKVVGGLRPEMPPLCPEWYADLIVACWRKEAASRRSFEEICQVFLQELGSTDGSSSHTHLQQIGSRPSYGSTFADDPIDENSDGTSTPTTPDAEVRRRATPKVSSTPSGLRRLQSSYL